ncbi:MAG: GumC family protein [Hyphomicrobiaceae bacterium]|nr:GumC family protein [Hyphomicrobiaceae bacterium]
MVDIPDYGRYVPPQSFEAPPAFGQELRALVSGLWRHKVWIVAMPMLALFVALVFLILAAPLYPSTSQVLIDPRTKRVVQNEVVSQGLGSSSVGADLALVDSQVEIMLSDVVLGRVVSDANLIDDPEFTREASGGGMGLGRAARGLFGLSSVDPGPPDRRRVVLEALRKKLEIKRLGNTYVVNIRVLSEDPRKAARLANAIAESYLGDQQRSVNDATRQTSRTLSARLDDLRSRLRGSEDAIESYRQTSGLAGTRALLTTEQQLQEVNNRLTVARGQTAAAKAKLDQLQRIPRNDSANAGAWADAINSSVIGNLRATLTEISRQEAAVTATLGDRHPSLQILRSQRADAMAQLGKELDRIVAAARTEWEVARANEAAIDRAFDDLKRQSLGATAQLVRLRELEREAEANRGLYESFLRRSKEVDEQENISTTNSRILSEATPSIKSAYPPRLIVLAAALIFGLGLGLLIAWLRFVMSPSALPAAGPPRHA